MRGIVPLLVVLIGVSLAGAGRPVGAAAPRLSRPGFDCARAATQTERLICSDLLLGDYDRAIAATYKLIAVGKTADAERAQQRAWIKSRDACSTADCVRKASVERLTALFESVPDGAYTFRRRDKTGTLQVLALGGDAYAFHVDAFYQGLMPGSVNVGEASGVVRTAGGVGLSQDDGCTIKLGRAGARAWSVEVAPESDCGVGHNVSLNGLYARR